MPTHAESLTAAFDSRDLERVVALLDERVIRRGLIDEQHENDEEHEDDSEQEHDHGPPNVYRS